MLGVNSIGVLVNDEKPKNTSAIRLTTMATGRFKANLVSTGYSSPLSAGGV